MATTATGKDGPGVRRWPNCFGCGSENSKGLHLHFDFDTEGRATASWLASRDYEGYEGVIHGGIITAALDEAMAQAVVHSGQKGVTAELRVRLRRHIAPGETLQLRGWITEAQKRKLTTEASLCDATGEERAHGWGTFLLLP